MDRIRDFVSLYQPHMRLLVSKIVTGARPAPPYLASAEAHQ
jgi:hypothetical protein